MQMFTFERSGYPELHWVKSVQIKSFFWFVLSLNAGKYGPEKTPYLDTFHTVLLTFKECVFRVL